MLAAGNGQLEMVAALLVAGADADLQHKGIDVGDPENLAREL